MVNPFEQTTEEHLKIYEAVRIFAQAIGCDISEEGGKEFARVVMWQLQRPLSNVETSSKQLPEGSSRFGAPNPAESGQVRLSLGRNARCLHESFEESGTSLTHQLYDFATHI
jgi:hypothetical protein